MLRTQPHSCATPFERFMLMFCLALLFLMGAGSASAGIIQDYPLGSFTLTNTNADGFATSGASSIVLVGPNNGSGDPGTTDLTTVAKATGLIQFQFSYSTLDIWDTSDPDATPFDYAGYLLGPNFVLLADRTGQSGTISIPVTIGQTFGFRVVSADNTGEPGILTISNAATAAVPEPGTWSLILVAGAGLAGARFRRAHVKKEKPV